MAERKLNKRQLLFCQEYIIDLNATAAYKRAGYTAKGNAAEVNAIRLLSKAKVKKQIQKLMDKRSKKVEITAENVLNDILDIRDLCKEKSITEDSEGNQQINKDAVNSRIKANELLGKHLKLFTDKIEHSGEIKMPIIKITK